MQPPKYYIQQALPSQMVKPSTKSDGALRRIVAPILGLSPWVLFKLKTSMAQDNLRAPFLEEKDQRPYLW